MTRIRAALIVVALTSSVRASAQSEPTTIPVALARAALEGFGDIFESKPTFVVGKAPDTWPNRIVPAAPARVIGGIQMGPMTMLVVTYPHAANGMVQLEQLLTQAGYTRPPQSQKSGFASTSVAGLGPIAGVNVFCGDSGDVTLAVGDSTSDTRTVVMGRLKSSDSYGTMCHPPERMAFEDHMPLKLPPLAPPPGARAMGGGSSGGGNTRSFSATTDTTYDAPFLARHYSAQLAAAGWKVGGSPVNSGVASVVGLSTTDAKGKEWHGALIVVPTATHREITISMATDRDH